MKVFKSNRTKWYAVVENRKEKQQLFKVISKRKVAAEYFHPDGKREQQFAVTPEEVDIINEHFNQKHGRSARRS